MTAAGARRAGRGGIDLGLTVDLTPTPPAQTRSPDPGMGALRAQNGPGM